MNEQKPHSELHKRLHDFRKLVNRKDLTAPEVYREWAILHGEIDGLLEQLEALRSAAEDSLSILDSLTGGIEFSRGEVIARLCAALYPAKEPNDG